jgi:CRISPR-associated protein Cas2
MICYDMADDRRRLKLANYLLGWGDRVLESVFECVWRADQMPRIEQELRALIDPEQDRLWLLPVCQRCRATARVNGRHRRVAHCTHVIV